MRWLPALLLAGCAHHAAHVYAPGDDQAIREVLEAQVAAWNRGDLDAYMDGYARTPDLVFTSGGNIRKGWDETREKYRAKYGTAPETMGKLDFEILGVQALGADGAVVLGRWALTETEQAGSGVFSVVLERRPEGWRVVHDHTSSDPQPPAE